MSINKNIMLIFIILMESSLFIFEAEIESIYLDLKKKDESKSTYPIVKKLRLYQMNTKKKDNKR